MLKKTLEYIANISNTFDELRPHGGFLLPEYSKERVVAELAFLNGTNRDLIKIGSNDGLYRLLIDKEGAKEHLESQLKEFSPLDIAQKIQNLTGAPIDGTVKAIENQTNFGKYLTLSDKFYGSNVLDILNFYRDLFSVVFEDLEKPVLKLGDRKDYTFILDDTFKDIPIKQRKGQFSNFAMDHLKAFFPAIFVAAYIDRIETDLDLEGKYNVVEVSPLSMGEIKFEDNLEIQELHYDKNNTPHLVSVGGSQKNEQTLVKFLELIGNVLPHVRISYTGIDEIIYSSHSVNQNNPIMQIKSDKVVKMVNWTSFLKDFVQKKQQAPVIKVKF